MTAAKQDEADFQYADSQSFFQDEESMIQDEADFQYADSQSFFQDEADFQYINEADSHQDEESMIQDEADFQYINEAEENMNLEFADEMSDCGAQKNQGEIQKNRGEIQKKTKNSWSKLKKGFTAKCPKGAAIYFVQSKYSKISRDRKWFFKCRKVSNVSISFLLL